MKAAPFEYSRPADIDEACALLAADESARLIAGGQTLVAMMAMRLARPTRLIDINRIAALSYIRAEAETIAIGATTRQCVVEHDPLIAAKVPLLARAIPWIGHAATRARGTIGGSLANADPAAECALIAITLDAVLSYRANGKNADIAAREFFIGPMITTLPAGAVLTGVRFPVWPGKVGVGFHEVNARRSDFAFVSAAAQVELGDDGKCKRIAIAVGAVSDFPLRLKAAEQQLKGGTLEPAAVQAAVAQALADIDALADLHASAEYRRRVAIKLAARAVADARAHALGKKPMRIELDINGTVRALEVEPRTTLLDCLRDQLALTGAHAGCEHGVCGACTVLFDGVAVRSCLMFAVQAQGSTVTTIEGVTPGPGELSVIQDAFCETHGMQCGYCTPAMVLVAHALLANNPAPTREDIVEAISGNICRCTGYAQIVEAIALAAERMRGANRPSGLHT